MKSNQEDKIILRLYITHFTSSNEDNSVSTLKYNRRNPIR